MAKKIGATEFKATFSSLLNNLDPEGIIITKSGKPVAKLIPIESDMMDFFGKFKDKVKVHGSTLSTDTEWKIE